MKVHWLKKCLARCGDHWICFVSLIFMFSPASVFAVGATTNNAIDLHTLKSTFLGAISSGDLSVNYMSTLFGYLDGSNVHVQSPLIGEMIKYFNFGVLFFIAGTITYATSIHVIKTANQGSAMGNKSGAATSLIRVATSVSFALPLPAYGGFCALQLFVLSAVLQGIGIANYAWDGVVAIYNDTGSILPMVLRAQSAQQANSDSAPINNLKHLANQSTQLVNTQLCHLYNLSVAQKKAAARLAEQRRLNPNGVQSPSTTIDIDQIIRFTAPQNNRPGKIDSTLVGDDYLPCPIVQFSGQLASEAQFTKPMSASEKSGLVSMRWGIFKSHYQALLRQVTQPMLKGQRVSQEGDVAMSQCIYNEKKTAQPIMGCHLLPTFDNAVRIYQQRLLAVNEIAFKRLLDEGVIAKPDNTPAHLNSGLGWLSAGMLYHKILGTTSSDTLTTLFNQYNAMGDNALLVGAHDFNVGNMQKDQSSGAYSYRNHDISLADYQQLRRVWQLLNTGQSYTDQGPVCNAASSDIHCQSFFDVKFCNAASSDIHCQSFAHVVYALAAKNQPVPDHTNALQQLKSHVSQAAYSLMPKNGLSARNYQDALPEVADEKQHHDHSVTQILMCAGFPIRGVSLMGYTLGPQSVECPNGGEGNSSFFGFLFSIFEPLKNAVYPTAELQSAGFGGDIQSRSLFIDQDIRIFIVDIVEAWFKMIAQDQSVQGGHLSYDPLMSLSDFGIASTTAGYDFLVRVTQDIWLSNYIAFMKSALNAMKYSTIAAGLWKETKIINHIGDAFENMAGIPFIGPIFMIIGILLKFGSVIPNFISTYYTSLGNSAMLTFPIVVASQTLYSMVSVAVVIVVMTLGIMFATFIPMLPFIIFTFTAIGWMMSVIEAVVAAPIVAAGVASPQGHDFLGKAQQIGMMLASAMLRPICILIGFLMAILVFIAGVKLMNLLFVAFINKMVATDGGVSLGSSAAMLLMMYAYGLVLYSLVDFVFALTHLLPTFVVRWIGLRPIDAGEAKAILGIEGGMRDNLIGNGLEGASGNAAQFKSL